MRIAVLGPFELRRDDGTVVPLGGPRERAVLAVLALRAGELVSIDGLVDAVWGDDAPASAVKNVQTYVSQLRRRLAGGDARGQLLTAPGGYVVPGEAVEVDARVYERHVEGARRALAAGAPGEASDHLHASASLWRGDPLVDLGFSPVLAAEATRLREVRAAALELGVEVDLARGRHAEVLPQLQRLLAAHPLRERLWVLMMTALYRCGRQADALGAYRRARELLVRELGIDPGTDLQELERRVLAQDPSLAAPQPSVERMRTTLPSALREAVAAPFVGRRDELDMLVGAWRRSGHDTAAVLLAGEPGIGKTRLAAALAEQVVAEGAVVLHGRCDPEALIPYQPFVEALRGHVAQAPVEELRAHLEESGPHLCRLLPDLARRVPDLAAETVGADRYALFEAVTSFLVGAARRQPLLVVLDDLHWADAATLLLLRHLLRLERSRLLLVVTYRDTELRPTHPLAETLALLRREAAVERIALDGLSPRDVEELATRAALQVPQRSVPGLAARVHAETRGNALFVREVLRHLERTPARATGSAAFDLPEGIREVIGRRVAVLPPAARRLLAVAALLGREFEVGVLAEVAELAEDDVVELLDEAVGAHLLEEVPRAADRYAFPHALVRAALVDDLSASRRVRLHTRAAEVLERLEAASPGSRLVELAHHLGEAAQRHDVPRAVRWTCRAGELAVEQLAYEEAERSYRRALELLDLLEVPDLQARCDVLLGLGDALARHDHSRARDVLLEAAELARDLSSPTRLARAAVLMAGASGFTSSDDPEVRLLVEAEQALAPDDPALVEVIAASVIASNAFAEHEVQVRRSSEALAVAGALGDDRLRTRALVARMLAMSQPDEAEERIALADELLAQAELRGDLALTATAQRQRIWGLVEIGRLRDATKVIDEHRRLARRVHDPLSLMTVAAYDGMLALAAGRYDEASAAYDHMTEVGPRTAAGADALVAAAAFTTHVQQRRLPELRETSEALAERYAQIPVFRTHLAVVAAASGDQAAARAALAAAAPGGVSHLPGGLAWAPMMYHLSLCAVLLHDACLADEVYAALLPHAPRTSTVSGRVYNGANAFHLGRLAAAAGRARDAEMHLMKALCQHEDDGADAWTRMTEEALGMLPGAVSA